MLSKLFELNSKPNLFQLVKDLYYFCKILLFKVNAYHPVNPCPMGAKEKEGKKGPCTIIREKKIISF